MSAGLRAGGAPVTLPKAYMKTPSFASRISAIALGLSVGLSFGVLPNEAAAQLIPKSSLSLDVKAVAQASGARTSDQSWYYQRRDYSGSFVLQVDIHNLSKESVACEVEWFFTAKPMRGGKAYVFDKGSKQIEIAGGQWNKEQVASEVVEGTKVRDYYYQSERGSKKDGWIVRVKENGQITRVRASSTTLEAIAKNPAQMEQLLAVRASTR